MSRGNPTVVLLELSRAANRARHAIIITDDNDHAGVRAARTIMRAMIRIGIVVRAANGSAYGMTRTKRMLPARPYRRLTTPGTSSTRLANISYAISLIH